MNCNYCHHKCWRAGRQKSGLQRYYCRTCGKYQQFEYRYKACSGLVEGQVKCLIRESVGVRGISRILGIACGTVLGKIRRMAKRVDKPTVRQRELQLEVDELWTFKGRKSNEYWVAYAMDRQTRKVVDFVVGKRTKATLKELIDRLLLLKPKVIRTDRLTLYERLIPKRIHRSGSQCINRIERKNLSIRTHLKRLSRRTICFTRSIDMLESCLRLYFWEG